MASAKEIRVAPIKAADAREHVRKHHYSGKVVNNSCLHFGVFLNGRMEGAMQYGPSLDKRKIASLVEGTPWHGFIELNRMAFSERLPRNSESRAMGIAHRLIRNAYPQIEWIVSFADASQCGDGTIYRAAGFVLTGIKRNNQILQMPDGKLVARITVAKGCHILAGGGAKIPQGAKPLPGFQLRYIYFLNPAARERLTVPVLPFSRIAEMGASMYRGERRRPKQATPGTTCEAAGQNRPGRSNLSTAGTDEPA